MIQEALSYFATLAQKAQAPIEIQGLDSGSKTFIVNGELPATVNFYYGQP